MLTGALCALQEEVEEVGFIYILCTLFSLWYGPYWPFVITYTFPSFDLEVDTFGSKKMFPSGQVSLWSSCWRGGDRSSNEGLRGWFWYVWIDVWIDCQRVAAFQIRTQRI